MFIDNWVMIMCVSVFHHFRRCKGTHIFDRLVTFLSINRQKVCNICIFNICLCAKPIALFLLYKIVAQFTLLNGSFSTRSLSLLQLKTKKEGCQTDVFGNLRQTTQ